MEGVLGVDLGVLGVLGVLRVLGVLGVDLGVLGVDLGVLGVLGVLRVLRVLGVDLGVLGEGRDASLNSQLFPCLNSSVKEGCSISSTTKLNDLMEAFLESSMRNNGDCSHVIGTVQRKPGRGDATLSVSCSDKISRTLLSHILQPVYISSITVGQSRNCFDKEVEEQLIRALSDRVLPLSKKLTSEV
ncbi:hypothetical protein L2E82_45703 [Cichorium intybus]|uniref:Uncharacterized protein n=1 Tax=Cichorium intybus TaxID=13427 RepID=A0ACB8ZTR3_CICIN|nr:hypothetical protein L2E82_45703 [Cichorium intybus]